MRRVAKTPVPWIFDRRFAKGGGFRRRCMS
jgi:hypothetical protein